MGQEKLLLQIAELEREIAALPEGSINQKRINEKKYFYHRINRNGKRSEKYVSFETVSELSLQIEKRKELEKQLKLLKKLIIPTKEPESNINETSSFKTIVRIGQNLQAQIESTKKYKKRECINELRKYVFGKLDDKVFIYTDSEELAKQL